MTSPSGEPARPYEVELPRRYAGSGLEQHASPRSPQQHLAQPSQSGTQVDSAHAMQHPPQHPAHTASQKSSMAVPSPLCDD
ncbi:hypothetical protein PF005_g14833 [Phytophthora fragariae]|uniref:Uncharacterized protein n=1 Tax=Phytophthora fragariae TaxID=53985 RepID=A0A6A3YH22_9STRA|nr:hypothetical protein PF003_g24068 [Phytophthora fragariae]KAE8933567.1 hypothetical protein PF009_g16430 [Phytophthora fragariae]KAE9000995.1 hypothetical protein PF011_g13941 [Phytophthora fragariae]KAE9101187.1 hypothetical protein PF007_g15234 [Phytophthora fragariae]KAE9103386.1 hypothetical protein PF010_g13750 [Phytophthora fragariae]